MIESSPRTLPQFLIGIVHFLVASKVAKYKAFIRACELGNTLLCSDECRRRWWKEHPEAGNKPAGAYYNQVCAYCGRFFSSYGKKGRKYCCHDCYIMDRFWSDDDKGRVVAKNPDRKTIKIAL